MRIISLSILILYFSFPVYSQTSADQWTEDIEYLQSKIASTVPGITEESSWSTILDYFKELKDQLDDKTDHEVIIHIQKALNLVNDEGCRIYPFQSSLNYQVAPVKTFYFDDGYYIVDAFEPIKDLIHQKITKINNRDVDSLFLEMSSILNADSEHYRRQLFNLYSLIPNWRDGNNIEKAIEFTLESGDRKMVETMDVQYYVNLKRNLAGYRQLTKGSRFHAEENYWMEYLENKKTLFIQFLMISDQKNGDSFKAFTSAVEHTLNTKSIDKLIIDNRYGGGGNGFKLKPFTDMIREASINRYGKLFVLTSPTTRGTVAELTSILEFNTKAVMVGKPTGEGPNSVGDITMVTLPNSKLVVSLTKKYWPTSWEQDQRKTIEPHIPVYYTFSDYLKDKDPWLLSALNFKEAKPVNSNSGIKNLSGNYTVNGKKISIIKKGESYFLQMNRKIQSFFEIHSEVYLEENNRLSTDISEVYFDYETDPNGDIQLNWLNWKGQKLKIDN